LKAQKGHEHATSVLLRRNVDVTAVDESGRTAVDLAQNRWIQSALRRAWNAATSHRLQDASNVAASNSALTDHEPVSPPRSTDDSQEQLSSSAGDTPRLRSGKPKPFERSRSLDQQAHSDVNRIPSVHIRVSRRSDSLPLYDAFFGKINAEQIGQ